EEFWVRGRLVEQRLSHGEALEDERGIVATDACDESLVAACDTAMEELRRCVVPDIRMRLVAEARLDGVTSTITASLGAHSVVSDPAYLPSDLVLLRRAALPPEVEARPLPLVWKNGSAAVLLHEASGHPSEQNVPPRDWPEWLQVEHPLALRRASFRDVPLLRMTDLVARQQRAPFAIPEQRIDVLLVDGGAYDPLTDVVTLRVGAADLVEGSNVRRVAPFTFRRPRTAITLLGATGDPIRYPGVVCSREGQELVVGSFAPVMVTA
ncbi:MAG TPA: hypothetical protein VE010_20530, partial [Thermoanaerobaculia bacterium]|nr:hypothetical protein [Thermoanaerobaculia bacterium]